MQDLPFCVRPALDSNGEAGAKITYSGTATLHTMLTDASSRVPERIILTCDVPTLGRFSEEASTDVATTKFDFYIPAGVPFPLWNARGLAKLDLIAEPGATGAAYYTVLKWFF